jgi:hypothetical protein
LQCCFINRIFRRFYYHKRQLQNGLKTQTLYKSRCIIVVSIAYYRVLSVKRLNELKNQNNKDLRSRCSIVLSLLYRVLSVKRLNELKNQNNKDLRSRCSIVLSLAYRVLSTTIDNCRMDWKHKHYTKVAA